MSGALLGSSQLLLVMCSPLRAAYCSVSGDRRLFCEAFGGDLDRLHLACSLRAEKPLLAVSGADPRVGGPVIAAIAAAVSATNYIDQLDGFN